MRYADQFGDFITDEYLAKEKAATEADLAALHAIDRSSLDATDQLAYDVFEYGLKDTLRGYEPDILDVGKVRPINHFSGFHTFYPTFSSGSRSSSPSKSLKSVSSGSASPVLAVLRRFSMIARGSIFSWI